MAPGMQNRVAIVSEISAPLTRDADAPEGD